MRKLVGAVLMSVLIGTLVFGLKPTVGRAQVSAAKHAVDYLNSQQNPDGSIGDPSYPSFAPGETEDFLMGAIAAGFDAKTLLSSAGKSGFDYLATDFAVSTAKTDAGKTAKLILTVQAGGFDPTNFGDTPTDLVSYLEKTFYNSGTGAYGTGVTFTQSLAILSYNARGVAPPKAAVPYLLQLQDSDSSWNTGSSSAVGGDTNATAIALMALDAIGNHSEDASALAYLHIQQNADGGFPSSFSTDSDPNSDAIVIEALIATGQNPNGCAWTKGSGTPIANLLTFQDATTGGFIYPGNSGPDAFTTSSIPQALALQALPVHPVVVRPDPLSNACIVNTPTPTPSPTGSIGTVLVHSPSPAPTNTGASASLISSFARVASTNTSSDTTSTNSSTPSATPLLSPTPSPTVSASPTSGVLGITSSNSNSGANNHSNNGTNWLIYLSAALLGFAVIFTGGFAFVKLRY